MEQVPYQKQYLNCVILQTLCPKNAIYISPGQKKMVQRNLQKIQRDSIFFIQRAHKQTDKKTPRGKTSTGHEMPIHTGSTGKY